MRQRLRGVRWAHNATVAGAVIGALAAIGGLWAQAWTAYYAGRVAQDQLQQSRDEQQQYVQEQADLVTVFVRHVWDPKRLPGFDTRSTIHVVNRSDDPVTSVRIQVGAMDGEGGLASGHTMWSTEFDIPPCTALVFSSSDLRAGLYVQDPHDDDDDKPSLVEPLDQSLWYFADITFVDRRGHGWTRSPTSLASLPSKEPYEEGTEQDVRIDMLKAPTVQDGDKGPCAVA